MKKVILAVALFACVASLAGCQSKTNTFDDADSNAIENSVQQPTDDSGEPPVPPEPTEAQ
jgi:predicted small lipoprotein YifL